MDREGEEGGGRVRPVSPSTGSPGPVPLGDVSLGAVAAGVTASRGEQPGPRGGVGRVADPEGAPGSAPSSPDEEEALRPDLLPVGESRRSLASRTWLFAAAALCFTVGLLLWPVPVATGLPFHVGGLLLLALASRRVARALNRWEQRLPERFSRPLRRVVASVRARFHRDEPGDSESEGAP